MAYDSIYTKCVYSSDTQGYIDFTPYINDFRNGILTQVNIHSVQVSTGELKKDTVVYAQVTVNNNPINRYYVNERTSADYPPKVWSANVYTVMGTQELYLNQQQLEALNWKVPIYLDMQQPPDLKFSSVITNQGKGAYLNVYFNTTGVTLTGFNLSSKFVNDAIAFYPVPALTNIDNRYTMNIYNDVGLVYSYTGNQPTTVPAGTFKPNMTYRIDAKLETVLSDGTVIASKPSTFNLSGFEIPTPNVNNLLQNGDYWEKAITVNCRADNYTSLEWELWEDNVKLGTTRTTTVPYIIINSETFTSKDNCSVRVRGVNTYQGTTVYSDWREINLRLKDIQPTVENLAISGSNIDYPITVSVDSTYQEQLVIEVWKDDNKVKEYTTTTEKQVIIPANKLTVGLHKFKVKVGYKGRWTNYIEFNATLTETLPSIGAFEPDGTVVKRDDYTRVWWFPLNQSKRKLTIDGTITYTGTTEKELILPPATLSVGNHNMLLEVWFVSVGGVQKPPAVKKAEFVVRGKPSIPTILSPNKFSSNRPTFRWDSNGQQGYLLQVLDSNNKLVHDTEWKNGLIVEHRIATYLADGNYTVRIKVMNVQGEESEWGTQKFTIATVKPKQINLSHIVYDNSIGLVWDNPNNAYSMFYVFRNDKMIAKTDNTQFEDYICNKECLYFVRGVNENDIYSDSNKIYADITIRYGIMATVDNVEDFINVGISRNQWQFNGNINIENNMINLTGREYPVTIFGEHTQEAYTLNFVAKDDYFKFVEMCKRRQVFCYRDKRQTLYLTIPNPSYNIDKFGCTYNIQAHTVDYSEVVEYE